jgi:hypothetical protein
VARDADACGGVGVLCGGDFVGAVAIVDLRV